MSIEKNIQTIICGVIDRETIINNLNQVSIDRPGGSLLYAASGHALFNKRIGLIAKTNQALLDVFSSELEKIDANLHGIVPGPFPIDDIRYYRIYSRDRWDTANYMRHFYELGHPVPKFLFSLKDQSHITNQSRRAENLPLTSADFPSEYTGASALLITPLNYKAHFSCPPSLRTRGVETIFLRSSSSYMIPRKLVDISRLLQGVDFFFTTERDIRTLFKTRFSQYRMMLEALQTFGAKTYIIKKKKGGYFLMNADSQRLCIIPDSPVFTVDPIGEDDCFCGAFMGSFENGLSLEECAANASATASICREGSGFTYILNAFPMLLHLRAELIAQDITYAAISSIKE